MEFGVAGKGLRAGLRVMGYGFRVCGLGFGFRVKG